MRVEESSRNVASNGYTGSSNGSTPRKTANGAVNSHSPTMNGSSHAFTNGTSRVHAPVRSPYYRGHNREELTRILIQGLVDMGYPSAASTLSSESGYEVESSAVAGFRSAILEGSWADAEHILLGNHRTEIGGIDGKGRNGGLVLAEGANKDQMLFRIRQQKFLELLEQRDLGQALMVLRQELAPLNHDIHQLHVLSSLLMCPPEDLRAQAHWPATVEESRSSLLHELTSCIAPSVMIRDHRLAELLDQVKEAQINQCLYHNTSIPPSLYADHRCHREDFPSRTSMQLDDHTGEVWHVQFSHDGSKLATASKDKSVIIYETTGFSILHRFTQHDNEVVFVAWSPDDKKLISCSTDFKARVWDVSSGRLVMDLAHGPPDSGKAITSAAWAPDSTRFVTTSHDAKAPICLWTLHDPEPEQPIHTWTSTGRDKLRCLDCVITPDGQRLIVINDRKTLHVYDMNTYQEISKLEFASCPTCLTISRDSRTLLVNLTECEIHMFDLEEMYTIRKFKGQKQGKFIIRNCFGGAAENFVLSGSEDGKVYIWHKENSALIETLVGHSPGPAGDSCVTTVAWNPQDAGMFASGGDDQKVRIWTNSMASNETLTSAIEQSTRMEPGRTSAIRSTYRHESNL